MNLNHLKSAPFQLDDAAIDWVQKIFSGMTPDEKLRQLFNLMCPAHDEAKTKRSLAFRPGGITRKPGPDAAADRKMIADANNTLPAPLLVSADLEGSLMSLPFGAEWPNPLALAAIDDLAVTEAVSQRMAEEAIACGINWSFTPVLDINHAFRSAIVATRGFGSDVDVIERHAIRQMEVFQRNGIASAVKHWPGEGYDDRDQHLVTTINPLSMPEWHETFGRLYKKAIANGAMSVMSAHIALPSFVRGKVTDPGVEAFRPASISHLLTKELLRGELGFNGLVVSDATAMAGLGAWSGRAEFLPELIVSGCDVILFSDDPEQDLRYLKAALEDGRLVWDQVNAAVLRQLGMKAALGLNKPAPDQKPTFSPDTSLAEEIARKAPTLVKDVKDQLPIDPAKHKRVLVFSTGVVFPFFPDAVPFVLPDLLAASGFEVTIHTPEMDVNAGDFDLILYLFGDETLLTRGRIFLDWLALTGQFGTAMRRYWHDVPTIMVSFGYPYMLYDAPRAPIYINAYSSSETMQKAVHDLLLGKGEWNTNNPVDPFAGLEDAKY